MSNDKEDIFDTYRELIQNISPCMNDYLYVVDFMEDKYYISEYACLRFALPGNYFQNVLEVHRELVYEQDYDMLMDDLQRLQSGKKNDHNIKYRWMGRDGKPIWINCRGVAIKDSQGNNRYMIGCINEIGKKQMADNVSGLMGEMSFIGDIYELEEFSKGFVLRIGIDDFKKINEKNGTVYGDYVLEQMADIIKRSVKPEQKVYRIVADEFLITDFSDRSFEEAKDLYNRIRNRLSDKLTREKYKVLYTVSGGILLAEDIVKNANIKITSYDDLLRLSQFALSQAKLNGKNQYYQFKEDDYNKFFRRRELEVIFRNAVEDDFCGFSLNYQPIVNPNEGNVAVAESLLRFKTKEGENISPMEMIPCLEETGLIIPVGRWIMKTAFSDCKEFCKLNPDFKITINLSYEQLLKSKVYDDIKETLISTGLSSEHVIVELTESGDLENNINVLNTWRKLKLLGVTIAVDDFGTGYSNLSHIGDLRPDLVKIDRQFTCKALKDDFAFLLMENIIKMVHNMRSTFVVEGIERKEEIDKIMKLCPDFIQGFYYGRPSEKNVFIESFMR